MTQGAAVNRVIKRRLSPWKATFTVALAVVVTLLAAVSPEPAPGSAASATLRVDPPTQNVAGGQKFTVSIVQRADVPTNGVQTNFVFNPALLRIVGVEAGAAYKGAQFIFGRQDQGTSRDVATAVAAANRDGMFKNLTTIILPGAGSSVPPGDAVFLKLTLQALGPAGTSELRLEPLDLQPPERCAVNPCYYSPVEMIDAEGQTIPVTTQNGSVTIAGGSAAPPEGATDVPATPTLMSTVDAAARSVGATLTIAPVSNEIAVGATTKVNLRVKVPVESLGVKTDLAFDNEVLELVSVEKGEAWSEGLLVAGTSEQTPEQAVGDSNDTGSLKAAGVLFYPGFGSVQAGEETVLTLTVRGLEDGESTIKASNIVVIDTQGEPLNVDAKDATLTVGSGGGGSSSSSMMWVGLALGAVVVAGVGGSGYWMYRRSQS